MQNSNITNYAGYADIQYYMKNNFVTDYVDLQYQIRNNLINNYADFRDSMQIVLSLTTVTTLIFNTTWK